MSEPEPAASVPGELELSLSRIEANTTETASDGNVSLLNRDEPDLDLEMQPVHIAPLRESEAALRRAQEEGLIATPPASSRRRTFLRVWQRICILALCYLLPSGAALLSVLLVDWEKRCNAPLRVWAVGQVALQVLASLTLVVVLWRVRRALLPRHLRTRWRSPLGRVVERALRSVWLKLGGAWLLVVGWLAWLLLGLIWTFEVLGTPQRECAAVSLFRVAFAACVVQLVLLGMLLLCCCCSCLVLLLRIWVAPPLPRGPRGASKEQLERLPSMPYVVGDPAVPRDSAMCAVCLSDYEAGEELRPLPCCHHFHKTCIDQWLLTNKSCPFCKHEIDQPPPALTPSAIAAAAAAAAAVEGSREAEAAKATTIATPTAPAASAPSDAPAPPKPDDADAPYEQNV